MNNPFDFNIKDFEESLLKAIEPNHQEPLTLRYVFETLTEYLVLLSFPQSVFYKDMDFEDALAGAAKARAQRKALIQLFVAYNQASDCMSWTLDDVMAKLHE